MPGDPTDDSVLDNPVWHSINGIHAGLAVRGTRAGRYRPEVSVFGAVADHRDGEAWAELASLLDPGRPVALVGLDEAPPGWEIVGGTDGVQMVGTDVAVASDPEAVELGVDDVPEMLGLVERTRPGPFGARTLECGRYLGIRRQGTLVAMAGERFKPPGWTEISAVCTDPVARGQGLATRLIRAVAAEIRARGDVPFLHSAGSNRQAIGLYESMGFALRRTVTFAGVRPQPDRRYAEDLPAVGRSTSE